ncbi:hypothetical protein D3C87_1119510 [compost metagenome]
MLLQIGHLDLGRGRTLLAPLAIPDLRTAQHGIGIDGVDTNARFRPFQREATGEMNFRSLRRAISGSIGRGCKAVLGRNENHVAAEVLTPQQAECFARNEEIARGENVDILVPHGKRRVFHRSGRGNAGIGDENIHAAEFHARFREGGNHGIFLRHVKLDGTHRVSAVTLGEIALGRIQRRFVNIGEHHAGALARQAFGGCTADAAGATGDKSHATGKALRLRHALQLCLFQQPIFDIKGFLLGKALIVGHGGSTAHDVDGVDVEFAGDTGRRLVLGEGQHADTGDQENHRVRVAHIR